MVYERGEALRTYVQRSGKERQDHERPLGFGSVATEAAGLIGH